jgi:hypothetical protein
MPDRPLIDVVRAVVADVAPDELADFERVARGYAASAAKRGWPWHTESSASASVVAGQPVAALVTAVGAELGTDVVLLGAPTVRRRIATLWSRLRGRTTIDLDSPPPAVREVDVARLQAAAITMARARGASDDVATSIGTGLARQWPRLF